MAPLVLLVPPPYHQVQGLQWLLNEIFFPIAIPWLAEVSNKVVPSLKSERRPKRGIRIRRKEAVWQQWLSFGGRFLPAGALWAGANHHHQTSKKLQLQPPSSPDFASDTFLSTLPRHGLFGPGYRCSGRFGGIIPSFFF